jgi:hypothetical protein
MAVGVTLCGYGEHGWVTIAGTLTNNTDSPYTFVYAAVALIKNGQVVQTDQVSLASTTGENLGVLHGLDYVSKTGGLAPGETWEWSIAYPLVTLTQPFECEVSVTNYD